MVRNKRGGEKGRGVGVGEQTWKNICVLLTSLVLFIIAGHLFSSHWAMTEFLDIKELKYWKCVGFFWSQSILLCMCCSSPFWQPLGQDHFCLSLPHYFYKLLGSLWSATCEVTFYQYGPLSDACSTYCSQLKKL